jgi:hypothetical protein
MLTLISQIGLLANSKGMIGGLLLSAATMMGETAAPEKALSFDASVYVTTQNKIRMAVEKTAAEPLTLTLRDNNQKVVYTKNINKKDMKMAFQFDVSELSDGTYELEIASKDGSIKKQVDLKTPKPNPSRQVTML